MKKSILILAGVFSMLTAHSQVKETDNSRTITERREIGTFTKIDVTGPVAVSLVSGKGGSIMLEGDSNDLKQVTVKVNNGILTIAANSKVLPGKDKIIAKVPFDMLTDINLTGAGSIYVKQKIKNDVRIYLDGSGCVNLSVNANNAKAYVLGTGTIKVKGKAQNFKCRVIGSGKISAHSLDAGNVDALVSGSGDAGVQSRDTLTGRISGSGSIAFSGEPAKQDLRSTGSGVFTRF
jgi:hypothetical protein